MKRAFIALVLLGFAAACAPQSPATQAPPVAAASPPPPISTPLPQVREDVPSLEDDPDACGASRYQHLVGQPEAAARAANLPQPHRVICYNCPVTMDNAPARLNVELNRHGRVESISCG